MNPKKLLETKLIPLLQVVAHDSVSDATQFKFDKQNPRQLTVTCVYSSIIELSHGQLALIEKDQTTAIPVILRSIFEAYADLCGLLEDPEYHKNMYSSFINEKLRFLRNAKASQSNPFLLGVAQGLDIAAEISSIEMEMAALKKDGHPPLKNHERFNSGKLEHEYQSIYWLLCMESHNNMSALDDRHIEKDGKDYHVALFREPDHNDLIRNIDALTAVLIDSGARIHEFLNSEAVQHYQSHKATLDAIRQKYPKT